MVNNEPVHTYTRGYICQDFGREKYCSFQAYSYKGKRVIILTRLIRSMFVS